MRIEGPSTIWSISLSLSLAIDKEITRIPSESPELASPLSRIRTRLSIPLCLRKTMKYTRMSADRFLESLFRGERFRCLRLALRAIAPLREIPAIGILWTIALALKSNVHCPVGGARKIVEAFAEAVRKNGGRIMLSKRVRSIAIENGKATGVILDGGSLYDADPVVSAVDAKQTFFRLIDPELVPTEFRRMLNNYPGLGTVLHRLHRHRHRHRPVHVQLRWHRGLRHHITGGGCSRRTIRNTATSASTASRSRPLSPSNLRTAGTTGPDLVQGRSTGNSRRHTRCGRSVGWNA